MANQRVQVMVGVDDLEKLIRGQEIDAGDLQRYLVKIRSARRANERPR